MGERYEHEWARSPSAVYLCVHCGMGPRSPEVECPALLRRALDESMARTTSWVDDYDVAREEIAALTAEIATLLPMLDADAFTITQICRERDAALGRLRSQSMRRELIDTGHSVEQVRCIMGDG